MRAWISRARHNRWAVLGLTALILVIFVGGGLAGRKWRQGRLTQQAYQAGHAAYAAGDWEQARRQLGRYVALGPLDLDVLAKYARAQLAVRPFKPENLRQAIGAYRQILRAPAQMLPDDQTPFRTLTSLCVAAHDAGTLTTVASIREQHRADLIAAVAQAKAAQIRGKFDTAAQERLAAAVRRADGTARTQPEYAEACVLLSDAVSRTDSASTQPATFDWLRLALEADPQSALALTARAGQYLQLATSSPSDSTAAQASTQTAAWTAAARADLAQAQRAAPRDPRVLLRMSELSLALDDPEAARGALDALRQLDAVDVQEIFPDPARWEMAVFLRAGRLALRTGDVAGGVRLAPDTLAAAASAPPRWDIVPLAIELLMRGGQVAQARQVLDTYLRDLESLRPPPWSDAQLALTQASVAAAEGNWFAVVNRLEPLTQVGAEGPVIRELLADAYLHTGQGPRAAQLWPVGTSRDRPTPDRAKQLARTLLDAGQWSAARQVLGTTAAGDEEAQLLRLTADLGAAVHESNSARLMDDVVSELTAWQNAHADRVEAYLLLASVAEDRGQLDAAAQQLRRATHACPEPLPAILQLARVEAKAGHAEAAAAILEEAAARWGETAAPWLAWADLLADQKRPTEARAVLERGRAHLTTEAEQRRIALRLAVLDLAEGDTADGVAALQALAREDPHNAQIRMILLGIPGILADGAAAQSLVDELKAIEGPTGLQWRYHQARLNLGRTDWPRYQKDSVEWLQYCIQAYPQWPAPALLLGELYERLGNWSAAETVYVHCFEATLSRAVLEPLLDLLVRRGRFDEIAPRLARLAERSSPAVQSALRFSRALGEGHEDAALKELETRAGDGQPAALDLLRLAEMTYASHRDAQAAMQHLDEAVAAGAPAVVVARLRVEILLQERRTGEAEQLLNRLVADSPTPAAYLLRAGYRAGQGQMAAAEEDYERLAELDKDGVGHALWGEFLAQTGRLDDAIATWKAGLQAHGDAIILKRALARACLVRGRPQDREEALRCVDEIEAVAGVDADLLRVRAEAILKSGGAAAEQGARKLLRQALDAGPADAATQRALIGLAQQLGEPNLARAIAARGVQFYPNDVPLLVCRGQLEFASGSLDVARDCANRALLNDPNNLPALATQLDVAAARTDHATLARGQARLHALLEQFPEHEGAVLLYAQACAALQQPEEAHRALAAFRSTEAGQRSLAAALTQADLYRQGRQAELAAAALDEAETLAPNDLRVARARLWQAAGEKRYADLLALLAPGSPAAQDVESLQSAIVWLRETPEYRAEVVRLCQRLVQLRGDTASYARLADALMAQDDPAGAEAAYRELLHRDPNEPEALNNLAWLLANRAGASRETLIEARDAARRAVAQAPDNANYRDTLAFALRQLPEELEAARQEYQRTIELAGADGTLRIRELYNLAQVCRSLGDHDAGADAAREALAADRDRQVLNSTERHELQRMQRGEP